MGTQFYNSGPVGVYCSVGTGNSILQLGWGEKAPDISLQSEFRPVECDLGGAVELDSIFAGERARVSVTLTRYSESVLSIIQARAVAGFGQGGTRGINFPGDIGTLMITEGASYRLLLSFPYAPKAAFQNANNGACPAGYRFLAAYAAQDDIMAGSTQVKKVRISWTCLRALDMTYTNGYGAGQLKLYDHDLSGLPAAA